MKANGVGYARTPREPYSRLIGYCFGELVYNGGYWDEETRQKQYEFLKHDATGKITEQWLVDYSGFKEIINKYDYPRK